MEFVKLVSVLMKRCKYPAIGKGLLIARGLKEASVGSCSSDNIHCRKLPD
jgi:hypothetical protein